jgi:hypothetical protein
MKFGSHYMGCRVPRHSGPAEGRPRCLGSRRWATLLRAHIEEARRRPRAAREYYEQFLRRYDRPMPSQAHLVEDARTALLRPARATEASQGR